MFKIITCKKCLYMTILLLNLVPSVSAFEINTHQALTRCAITSVCNTSGKIRSANLDNFIKRDALLDKSNYSRELLEGYGQTYLTYASTGEDVFQKYNITFIHGGNYIDMIEAGVVLEDAVWPGEDMIAFGGDGRFNSHFYNHQGGGGALTVGYGQRADAITWALNGATLGTDTFAGTRTNRYSLDNAFDYYRLAFSSALKTDRETAQAALFISLGHAVHILQDLHSTAHTRDDSHPSGDALEIFGREDKGFNLRNGRFNGRNDSDIVAAIRTQPLITAETARDFFLDEVKFTSEHYFSADTILGPPLPSEDSLSIETVYEKKAAGIIYDGKYYLNSTSLDINPKKLAIRHNGYLYTSDVIKLDDDLSILQENARTLMPRAVGSTEGFLNYFFRGRIKAQITEDGDGIEIKNISDTSLIYNNDELLTKFIASGQFDVFYLTDEDEVKLLMSQTLDASLAVDDTFIITGLADALQGATDIGEEERIVVLYDGEIGLERGLSVAFASKKLTDIDLLVSFDKSGSMGSAIETAKSSALEILPIIEGDTSFTEIEAFSSGVNVVQAYTNDYDSVRVAISGLRSGGGTALYDAVVSAGMNAIAQKMQNPDSKSLVILYTDGRENSSNASKTQAINAISKANASEIDEVFLIFVSTGGSGEADLKDIAARAGRTYYRVDNVSGLKQRIEDILISQ